MLTGVEIASLVLAILPLVISAIEHRDIGLEPANALLFRSKHKDSLRRTVDENKMRFRQCCEKILSMAEIENIADLLDETDKARLQQLWNNPQMQRALDTTFGGKDLAVILNRVREIQQHVKKLEEYSEAGIVIHTVMSTSRAKDVKQLGKAILALQDILVGEPLSIMIGTAGKAWREEIEKMKSTRAHLQNIYACVESSWGCTCKKDHSVNFQYREVQEADFKIILSPVCSRSRNKLSTASWRIRPLQISTCERVTSNPVMPNTASLCKSLGGSTGLPPLAEISPDHQYLVQVSAALPDPNELIPIWKASRKVLKSPSDRIVVGARLLVTVLQQHDVDWLRPDWTTDEVYLRAGPGCSLYPYFEATFNASKMPATTSGFSGYRSNPTLHSLGIALVELAMGSTIEKLFEDTERDMASKYPALARAIAADRLCDELHKHYVPLTYRNAARYCLKCEFGPEIKEKDLSNDELFSMVYRKAAKPLMECIAGGIY
ncbi:hypothetical protein CC86DRAFT_465570 [Ophiobolus disseminans]|uniref:DUF7580 domain-containing protein n=1 Tax=Ophiobolus disseminans TaxID=1469910 RepID=A0A6A7A7S2_9PLEO|nr:hypothetical protein CC86DRAFT_465570 [Ophiobolus disseminans]